MAFRPNFMDLNICYPITSADGVFSPSGMGNFTPINMQTPEFEQLKHEVLEGFSPRDPPQLEEISLEFDKDQEKALSIEIPPDSPPFFGFSPGNVHSETGRKLPCYPLDSNVQEQLKLDRKRERNRIAAAKCRKKKLDRIKYEETRIAHFKEELESLCETRNLLEKSVLDLRLQVWDHIHCGCNVNSTKEMLQHMKHGPANTSLQ